MEKKRFLVIGDTIIDKNIYLDAIGLSLESPTMKCKYLYTDIDFGGAAKVAKYVKIFGGEVDFCTSMTKEMSSLFFSKYCVNLINFETDIDTIKTRHYISNGDNTYNYLQINQINSYSFVNFEEKIDFSKYTAIAISDYRSGFVSDSLLNILKELNLTIYASSQLSNHEPNYDRYCFVKYLVCNKRESEFITRKKNVYITLGSEGSEFNGVNYPGIKVKVKKTIGAGDVYYAALLVSQSPSEANKMASKYVSGAL